MRGGAAALAAVASLVIGAAWFTEIGLGWTPCKLCLQQRWPYYAGIPLLALAAIAPIPPTARCAALLVAALVFLAGAGLAAYHVGVERGVFVGPTDCGGRVPQDAATVGDFLKNLETARIVRCDAPTLIFGVSMAAWNLAASGLIAACAAALALRRA